MSPAQYSLTVQNRGLKHHSFTLTFRTPAQPIDSPLTQETSFTTHPSLSLQPREGPIDPPSLPEVIVEDQPRRVTVQESSRSSESVRSRRSNRNSDPATSRRSDRNSGSIGRSVHISVSEENEEDPRKNEDSHVRDPDDRETTALKVKISSSLPKGWRFQFHRSLGVEKKRGRREYVCGKMELGT